jgi:hypothetical protein
MINELRRALADLLTPRFLLLSLLPLVVVVPLVILALASLGGGVADAWQGEGSDGNWLADWVATWPWVGGVAEFAWVRGLLGLVGAVAGWLLVVLGALFVAVAVVGLLTPYIVAEVRRRHYPDVPAGEGAGIVAYLLFLAKTLAIFLGLGLLALPLLFLPGLNLLAINLPFYYWFHRLLTWDVLEAACSRAARTGRESPPRLALVSRTLVLYALSLVPLLGLLLQVFFVLVLSHQVLRHATPGAGGPSDTIPPAT